MEPYPISSLLRPGSRRDVFENLPRLIAINCAKIPRHPVHTKKGKAETWRKVWQLMITKKQKQNETTKKKENEKERERKNWFDKIYVSGRVQKAKSSC